MVAEESDEDEDAVMMDGSDEDESQLFVEQSPPAPKRGGRKTAAAPAKAAPVKAAPAKRAPARAAKNPPARQSTLAFSQTQPKTQAKVKMEISDDEISDGEDAFEPTPAARATRSRR